MLFLLSASYTRFSFPLLNYHFLIINLSRPNFAFYGSFLYLTVFTAMLQVTNPQQATLRVFPLLSLPRR